MGEGQRAGKHQGPDLNPGLSDSRAQIFLSPVAQILPPWYDDPLNMLNTHQLIPDHWAWDTPGHLPYQTCGLSEAPHTP